MHGHPRSGALERPTPHGWTSVWPHPQFAERMFVARGTVNVHVSHIFARLGLSNRAELATLATRRSAGGDR